MKPLLLKAESRNEVGKKEIKHLRNQGLVPGIIYGAGNDPQLLTLNEHDLRAFLTKVGEHALVEVAIGNKSSMLALLEEIQHHPLTDRVIHVDFKLVPRDKPVEVLVPIEFIGESEAVHEGGLLMPRLHELMVKTLPDNVPNNIEVDVSELGFDHAIHISDVVVPEDVELLHEDSQTVVTVVRPRIIEVEEEVVEEVEVAEGEEVPEGEEAAPQEEEAPKESGAE